MDNEKPDVFPQELSINGVWNKGRINGNIFRRNDGVTQKLDILGPNKIQSYDGGDYTTAEIWEDGNLHWSNGTVWIKEKEAADGLDDNADVDEDGEGGQAIAPSTTFHE